MSPRVQVPCSPAEVAAYSDTRACRELGIVPLGWSERVIREPRYGRDHVEHVVVLVLGRPKP